MYGTNAWGHGDGRGGAEIIHRDRQKEPLQKKTERKEKRKKERKNERQLKRKRKEKIEKKTHKKPHSLHVAVLVHGAVPLHLRDLHVTFAVDLDLDAQAQDALEHLHQERRLVGADLAVLHLGRQLG